MTCPLHHVAGFPSFALLKRAWSKVMSSFLFLAYYAHPCGLMSTACTPLSCPDHELSIDRYFAVVTGSVEEISTCSTPLHPKCTSNAPCVHPACTPSAPHCTPSAPRVHLLCTFCAPFWSAPRFLPPIIASLHRNCMCHGNPNPSNIPGQLHIVVMTLQTIQ